MTSKHSFSKVTLVWDGLRRNLWCIVLSIVGFFMTLTLPVLMLIQHALEEQQQIAEGILGPNMDAAVRWQQAVDRVGDILGGSNLFVKLVFLVLAVVCGVAAYRYLHQRQQVDFYHALPISRTMQFWNRFVVGILCVLPVYLIMLALSVVCTFAMGFGEAVRWGYIGGSILSMLISFLLVYALSALAAILCGNTIISLLLLTWLLFGPAMVGLLKNGLCARFFQTYVYSIVDSTRILQLSPALQSFAFNGLQYESNSFQEVLLSAGTLHVIYLAAAVLVTLLCLFLYRIRKSERAGMALAFEPLKAPLETVMCLIVGLGCGLFFQMVANSFWFWPGLIIGTVLFHFLVEIIYSFDFHAIFNKPFHLAAILALLIGGCQILRIDVFGYDQYLPEESKIAAADLDNNAIPVLQSPENIRAVLRIAKMGIETEGMETTDLAPTAESSLQVTYDQGTEPRFEYVTVAYRLKNGRLVNRAYTIPVSEELETLKRQINSSEEYKRCKWTLFTFDPKGENGEEQAAIEVVNELNYESQGIVYEEGEVQQLLDTLRAEALTRPATAIPALRLNLGYQKKDNNGRPYFQEAGGAIVTRADTKTLAMIRQFTGVAPQSLTIDDVRSIEIMPLNEETWTAEVIDETDVAQMLKDAVNCEVFRMYGEEAFEDAFDELGGVRIVAFSKHGSASYTLCYPLGKTPTALIKKYSAEAKAAQPEDDLPKGNEIAADPVLPW